MIITYHLRRLRHPRLLLAAVPAGWLTWIGFRPGGSGTEVGDVFGPWGLARYWALVAPLLAAVVVPLVTSAWRESRARSNWSLAGADPSQVAADRYRVFLSGYLVYCAGITLGALFVAGQLGATPGWLPALLVVTAAGPLLGGYTVLALCYVAGTAGGAAASIALTLVVAVLDLTNTHPWAALSLSGTGDLTLLAGSWNLSFEEPGFASLPLPSPSFIVTRLLLACAATLGVLLARHRHPVR
ncbi:hypothetical protein ACFQ08_15565 [Streptosporangium algeriense]|uniref:ABC transporter permease n=1 Tax=Streptosporangium algeriense TaxID=1682748 RepID=A0ABW3DT54_9ACTN